MAFIGNHPPETVNVVLERPWCILKALRDKEHSVCLRALEADARCGDHGGGAL